MIANLSLGISKRKDEASQYGGFLSHGSTPNIIQKCLFSMGKPMGLGLPYFRKPPYYVILQGILSENIHLVYHHVPIKMISQLVPYVQRTPCLPTQSMAPICPTWPNMAQTTRSFARPVAWPRRQASNQFRSRPGHSCSWIFCQVCVNVFQLWDMNGKLLGYYWY